METTEVQEKPYRKEPVPNIKGKWQLHYRKESVNNKFGGRIITDYVNPSTGEMVRRRNIAQSGFFTGYFIDKLIMNLDPDASPQERIDIEWLLNHPEVTVKGFKDLDENFMSRKIDTSQITLIAVDYVEMEEIEQEDVIDRIVGRISLDGGPQALGLEKLRYVMASLNLPYRVERYMDDPSAEKKALRNQLKKHARHTYEQALNVQTALDNIENGERTFKIKEMFRLGLITDKEHGVFKFKNIVLGITVQGIMDKWFESPDLKVVMYEELDRVLAKKK